MKDIRIGLDIDEVIADFWGSYCDEFKTDKFPNRLEGHYITKMCQQKLRTNREFWLGLPLLRKPDFKPTLYCTKRVSSKEWTKRYLFEKHNLPKAPIYQMYYQHGNKADMIKGKVDLFIDDSISNVIKMTESGMNVLLMDTPGNRNIDLPRVKSLKLDHILEIAKKYEMI